MGPSFYLFKEEEFKEISDDLVKYKIGPDNYKKIIEPLVRRRDKIYSTLGVLSSVFCATRTGTSYFYNGKHDEKITEAQN